MQPYTHKVQYYETDKMKITHHSNYIRWMEEARVDYLEQIGFSYVKLEEDGIMSPVVSVSGNFKKTTTFGDDITITVSVAEFKGVKLILKYTMENDKKEIVYEGTSEHCFMSEDGKMLRLKKDYPQFYETLTNLAEEE